MSHAPPPPGYHSVTPALNVRNAPAALEFYERALGATTFMQLADRDGTIAHAEFRIGDSTIMLGEENPDWGNLSPESIGGTAGSLHVYVEDVDATVRTAVAAGATIVIPVADQFYGDRSGRIRDPFGHLWVLATRKENLTPEEVDLRFRAFMSEQRADDHG